MVNVQQTIRFILLNAYKSDLPDLTDKMQELYKSCPTLFEKVLPRSDRQYLQTTLGGNEDQEMDIEDAGDENHKNPSVIGRVLTRETKAAVHSIVHWVKPGEEVVAGWGAAVDRTPTTKLPLRSSLMTEPFRRQLVSAYNKDYNINGITLLGGRSAIQYCKRVKFSDKYVPLSPPARAILPIKGTALPHTQ